MQPKLRVVAIGVLATLSLIACGTNNSTSSSPSPTPTSSATSTPDMKSSKAADLRVKLDLLLGEHIFLAQKATDAALGGRNDEYAAYAELLNSNGTEIGSLIGAAYGADAQAKFNAIWSAHDGFFVDYTVGVATKDKAKSDKAVSDLTTVYVPQFSDFISSATSLPKDAVVKLTTEHVLGTKQIVDDEAAGNWSATYKDTRTAFAHMSMIGDAIASGVIKTKPEAFPGDSTSKAVDFRVAFNRLLQEHLFLASDATGAALGGRADEFKAAGDALNSNGTDIGAAVGSVYGPDAQGKFNAIWSAHNGFFVDYTTGVATKDKAKTDKAVSDLTTVYVPQFSDFLSGATKLPKDAIASLTTEHVLTTKAIVDAQGSKDAKGAASADVKASRHMQMIGDPLSTAIVAAMPSKF